MNHHSSIRDELEANAWRYPGPKPAARKTRAVRRPALDHRKLQWQDRALLILSAVLLLLLVVRVETARAADPANQIFGLEFLDPSGDRRTVAMDTDIQVEINGLTARIEVAQVFQNTGNAWKEAVYRYPLPPDSAVDRMRVYVGSRLLEGEIQEKLEARRQYRQAKASGRVASLVEQQNSNQFETRLANIGPGDDVRVVISFLAHVEYQDGTFSLRLPMTFTPRWSSGEVRSSPLTFTGANDLTGKGNAATREDHRLTIDIDLRSGMDLVSIESRYHDVDIHPSPGGYRIFLADPDNRSDRVFELDWTPEFGSAPISTISTYDDGENTYAMLLLAPPLAEAIAPRPREVVFVIDTSGSMEGVSMAQAKAALKMGLQFLGPDDLFNLVRFSSDSERLFSESAPTYPAYLEQASEFIEELSAGGGTVMAPALTMAMNLPEKDSLLRQIVFVTDGSVGNEQELLLQIGEELRDSRLFTVSIGSAPNEWFMRKAAEIGRGSHTHIGRLDDVTKQMSGLWSRIENPAIQNICVDWGMDAEFYPEVIPDLYAGEPLWLYARLPRQPREVLVCGDLEGAPWEMESRPLPAPAGDNLAVLWARSKVEAMEDSRIFGTDPEWIRNRVLDLALEFGLLTRYTSLVAVDKTPVRPASDGINSDVIPSLLPAGSGMATGFSGTATGWLAQVLLATFSLAVTLAMLLYSPPSRARSNRGDRSPMANSVS